MNKPSTANFAGATDLRPTAEWEILSDEAEPEHEIV